MSSTDTTEKPSGALRFSLMHLILFIAAVSVVIMPLYRSLNNLGHSGWTRASPFTDVQVDGDAAFVEFRGVRYELVAINEASTETILSSARRRYGYLGEKRFIEDLPEVLAAMGFEQQDTVSLELRDSNGNKVYVSDAPMTAQNRNLVYHRNSKRR